MVKRAGTYRTNLSGEASYLSFLPSPLPPDPPLRIEEDTVLYLGRAHSNLGRLEQLSKGIPDLRLFLSMHVIKEALLSSQIEGTQATLDDVLDPRNQENANVEVGEVVNYVKALEFGMERMKELPICGRLIKEMHACLMQGVRGFDKTPGEYRVSQNWIGMGGGSLKEARYIPPNVDDMLEAMSDLEKFINEDENGLDPLIEIALFHYQFETIHPFLDGNGRVGRLLIALSMCQKGLLSSPCLYLSYALKKERLEYYDRLAAVRTKGDYEGWVNFFLRATATAAQEAIEEVSKLESLHKENQDKIEGMGRSRINGKTLLAYLESHPIIEIGRTGKDLDLSFNAVSFLVDRFVKLGILTKNNEGKRNRTFVYERYLEILREGT